MLVIRLQRTGRTGHSQFRLIAQDKRFSPKSGRIVAYLGSYNPHTKKAAIDTDKISGYLQNGAQPSPRVIKLLKTEGVELPSWATLPAPKKRAIRNPEKLRRNRPAGTEPKPVLDKVKTADEIAQPSPEPATQSPTDAPPEAADTSDGKAVEPATEAKTTAEPKTETEPAVEEQPKAET